MDNKNTNYGADNIEVLEGLAPVRLRPHMYIGSTGPKGLHHCVYEVLDNSIDEVLAGRATTVKVKIYKDGSISVEDDGSGIPVETHKSTGLSTVETVLTILHAGGKFHAGAYKVSGGLHGVGVSVVNALSEWLEVVVSRNEKKYKQRFERGIRQGDLEVVGEAKKTGTFVRFKPDPEIFTETVEFDYEVLARRFKETAFLTKEVKIILEDERTGKKETFHYNGGIKSFVDELNKSKEPLHKDVIYLEDDKEGHNVQIAIQYVDGYSENVLSFANNINTGEGGTHVSGFRGGLTRTLNDYAREFNFLKEKDDNFQGEDTRIGLTAIISIKLPNPQYEGQTKGKLVNSETRGIVENIINDLLKSYLIENPKTAKAIMEKVVRSKEEREAVRKLKTAQRRTSMLEKTTLPGKLADCQSNDMEVTEIFLVEGDSAGGSAKMGRDNYHQAILPLKGKIMNVEKANLIRVLEYEEILSMISAFGTGIGDDFDISKLRYGKIIIMTDADVDGAHIMTLLLTFFYRYMPELIRQGHVYVANPPLYGLIRGTKVIRYCYDEKELEKVSKEIDMKNIKISRYKGLGEMNAEQLWDTTMNPDHRILHRVTIDDSDDEVYLDETFSILMGDKVEPRRQFIEENAKLVKNLDA
ncbi:DNA topoisomerase (ATP-hydrolyzing) subunit B [Neofamilia massiliensis]|uniref:DNA topoisomerase (ATP-hydrolyzing) subunit B n=1 Tax=Neofamilia massiliensis TaxID=1673724 RepID=UPI0006BB53E3|nr:DNA topoisomerase (ATP-hydrolyzing) subunit B [Neofamilia massiliensis]